METNKEALVEAPLPGECHVCGQLDVGQAGEYHCPECGLPRLWDDAQAGSAATAVDRPRSAEAPAYSAPFTADVPQCCGDPAACNDPCTGAAWAEICKRPAPLLWRKKPVVIEATQWFKNGDHPQDAATEMFDYADGQRPRVVREGAVVRYYRHPDMPGDSLCEQCGKPHHVHGWIDTLEQGHRVCPGDWVITGVKGERYPCKPDIFAATYEAAAGQAQPPAVQVVPALTTCNCRWDAAGNQVQQCKLHAAHVDAIYEWSARAKEAEAKLAEVRAQLAEMEAGKDGGHLERCAVHRRM